MLVVSAALDSEGAAAVPLTGVFPLCPSTNHVRGDLAVVVQGRSCAATKTIGECD